MKKYRIDIPRLDARPYHWDCYLKENYNLKLFEFAYTLGLAIKLGDPWTWRPLPACELKDLKNNFEKLKKDAINLLVKFDSKLQNENEFESDKSEYKNRIIKSYKAEYFFENIDNFILPHLILRLGAKHTGAPTKISSLVIFIWRKLFQKSNRRFHWNVIKNLFDWFYLKLTLPDEKGSFNFYDKIKPKHKSFNPRYLSSQFQRLNRRVLIRGLGGHYCNSLLPEGRAIVFGKNDIEFGTNESVRLWIEKGFPKNLKPALRFDCERLRDDSNRLIVFPNHSHYLSELV